MARFPTAQSAVFSGKQKAQKHPYAELIFQVMTTSTALKLVALCQLSILRY